jgi:hypothetical protein
VLYSVGIFVANGCDGKPVYIVVCLVGFCHCELPVDLWASVLGCCFGGGIVSEQCVPRCFLGYRAAGCCRDCSCTHRNTASIRRSSSRSINVGSSIGL